MKKILKKILLLLIVCFSIFSLCACKSTNENEIKFAKVDDINSHNVGVITGSIGSKIAEEKFPLSEVFYFSSVGDAVTALKENKIDTVLLDQGLCKSVSKENEDLTYLNESLHTCDYGAIFQKSPEGFDKLADFNSFIKERKDNGELTALINKWLVKDSQDSFDFDGMPNINGEFTVAFEPSSYPFVYLQNGSYVGFEIELIYRYCLDRGYKLNLFTTDFAGVLAAVTSGKSDCSMSGIIYSDERAEAYYFSDLYASAEFCALIRKENATSKFSNISDLEGGSVAVVTGGICDTYCKEAIKDVSINYYNSTSDLIESILTEKSDAACFSYVTYSNELKDRVDLKLIGNVGYEQCGYIFPQTVEGELLRREVNEFIATSKENGFLQQLDEKWHSKTIVKTIDYASLKDINGTLTFAASSSIGEPAAYIKDGKLAGLDIEFIVEFAKAYGYDIKFEDYSFNGMLQAVSSEKADFGGSNIAITDARKQSLLFSDSIYSAELVLCVYDETAVTNKLGPFETIYDNLYKTFIKENRYLLFIDGIKTTIIITLLSIVIGLLIGILMFSVYQAGFIKLDKIYNKLSTIISEMPTIVLLMIFYYVIFADSEINGLWVSIIAFSILFGISTTNLLKTCFLSIDKGQFEAAYALGYNKFDTTIKIIVPQIIPMFMDLFKGELINLVKSTSIVGYIAVQDLTKISDIVRSRTYQAFFPLIVTTIIYILIIRFFKMLIISSMNKLNNKDVAKSKMLKGVKIDDRD